MQLCSLQYKLRRTNKPVSAVKTGFVRTVNMMRTTGCMWACQPIIAASLLLDALSGVHSCETDRTVCVSVRENEIECVNVLKGRGKKTGQMQPNCSRGLGEWMPPALIHSILLDLWIVSKSCYVAHDAPGSSCTNQICLLLPVRRQENPQETQSSIGGSFREEEVLPFMYAPKDYAAQIHDCDTVCVVIL